MISLSELLSVNSNDSNACKIKDLMHESFEKSSMFSEDKYISELNIHFKSVTLVEELLRINGVSSVKEGKSLHYQNQKYLTGKNAIFSTSI